MSDEEVPFLELRTLGLCSLLLVDWDVFDVVKDDLFLFRDDFSVVFESRCKVDAWLAFVVGLGKGPLIIFKSCVMILSLISLRLICFSDEELGSYRMLRRLLHSFSILLFPFESQHNLDLFLFTHQFCLAH